MLYVCCYVTELQQCQACQSCHCCMSYHILNMHTCYKHGQLVNVYELCIVLRELYKHLVHGIYCPAFYNAAAVAGQRLAACQLEVYCRLC